MLTKRQLKAMCAGALLATAAAAAFAQDAGKVLRMVPQSDLKILDPIWTTALSSRATTATWWLRHAVRRGRAGQGAPADGRQVHHQPRRKDLDLHAAQEPGLS
jgi:hypothetical protein